MYNSNSFTKRRGSKIGVRERLTTMREEEDRRSSRNSRLNAEEAEQLAQEDNHPNDNNHNQQLTNIV